VRALSGLGGQTTGRECKKGDGIKSLRNTVLEVGYTLIYRNDEGVHVQIKFENPSLVKLTFFIQRCCEPVYINVCSEKNLIFHRYKVFVAGLVTVQVPTNNTNGNDNKQCYC